MNKKVLLTFAGNTDPTRGLYDGPILHICRYYKPDKIYLILTQEMAERDAEPYNIYEKAIKINLKKYSPEIIKIYTDIKDAHKFDSYFEVISETFEKIKRENKDFEILVNLTSGTSQITSNLITYIIDSELNIIPLQVSSPEQKSNTEKIVNKEYDIILEAENNFDNIEEHKSNRIIEPDLKYYSRVFIKSQIQRLLEQYEYTTSLELLKRNVFKQNMELNTLLHFANDRKSLKGLECNLKLLALNNSNFNKLYYYKKNEKIEKHVKEWYKIVDYFALSNIKQKTGDLAGYIIMLEPLGLNILLSILRDIMKKKLEDLFDINIKYINKNSKDFVITKDFVIQYKTNLEKIKKFEGLTEKIEISLKNSLINNKDISSQLLNNIIEYFIENDNKINEKIDKSYYKNFSRILLEIKEVRNMIAHNIKTINKREFERLTEVNINDINYKIRDFFKKYYTELGYNEEMLNIYDNINKSINEILEKEIY